MADFTLTNFTLLDRGELEMVLSWRNEERVRRMMSDMAPIALEAHLAFVKRLAERKDCRYYLGKVGDRPLGVVDLTYMTDDGSTCNPGLYTAEGSPMGAGLLLELAGFHAIFDRFGYRTAWSLVKKENQDYSDALLRIFKMQREDEDEINYRHVFQCETWSEVGGPLMKRLFARFKVSRVVWIDPEGETVSWDESRLSNKL